MSCLLASFRPRLLPCLFKTHTTLRRFGTHRDLQSTSAKPPSLSNLNFVYSPEADVENLEGYCPGGYHPTHIDDEFCGGRYRIIHKLGYGSYSTVWLAHDREKGRYVSLKITTAQALKTNSESEIMRHLQSRDYSHPGREYVDSLLDEFSFEGPNGRHVCLVTDAAGCSIAMSKENRPDVMFPLVTARAITAEVIMGLAYLHSKGVGHGDLHCGNILLQSADLNSSRAEDIYDRFGVPLKTPVARVDKKRTGPEAPNYAVVPMSQIVPSDNVMDCKVKIIDFGNAFFFDNPPKRLYTPNILLPPEGFFHDTITPAADIWTLGCTLYEILGERPLFDRVFGDPDGVIAEIVTTFGKLPERWWQGWEKRPEFFDKWDWNSHFDQIYTTGFRTCSQRLWDMGRGETPETCQFGEKERESLKKLLSAMLVYEPNSRISVENAMNHDYMVNWALPALRKG